MKLIQNKLFKNSAVFLILALLPVMGIFFFGFSRDIKQGSVLGAILAVFNGFIGFVSVGYVMGQSDKIFYGTFFGNMLWKLVVLGGTFFYLMQSRSFHTVSVLVTLAFMTLFLNLLEVGLLFKSRAVQHGF